MNAVFLAIVLVAFLVAAWNQLTWVAPGPDAQAPMDALGTAMIEAATGSVTLAIGLIGVMALFLGLMKVAEAGGLLTIIARGLRPIMVRLFPEVPATHPAMGAMIMNLSANVMGLGNAATPFGIRAMQELDRLNPHKGTASDPMILFLAINTSSITLLPTGVIALRAAAGSADPAGILPTTLFATLCSTAVAIVAYRVYRRMSPSAAQAAARGGDAAVGDGAPGSDGDSTQPSAVADSSDSGYSPLVSWCALAGVVLLVPLAVLFGEAISAWIIPSLVVALLGFGAARRVRVYEVFVEGAREGFNVAVRIIPYLVAILVAVGMFRASGALELIVTPLGAITGRFGMPAEALPMALLRPLSGSGAYGVMASIINDPAIGPDSYTGYIVSTLQGSTETTFYVLAVYFGAVQVRRIRYALAAGLTADLAGIIGAVAACYYLYA